MPTKIMICADDYAITPGVSRGIVECLEARRINATSVMSASKFWPETAPWLKPYQSRASIGLHFTLTGSSPPLTKMPRLAPDNRLPNIKQLLMLAYTGRLPLGEIETELMAQHNAFVDKLGIIPQHIDGHEHVHLLPGIREKIIKLAASYPQCLIRNCGSSFKRIFRQRASVHKALFISGLSRKMEILLAKYKMRTNSGFLGIYNFDLQKHSYEKYFSCFLRLATDKSIIMCHPGYGDEDLRAIDLVVDSRDQELQFLLSNSYINQMKSNGILLD